MGLKGKLYTTGDIADLLGVTRQRAYALSRRKGFPDPYDEWAGGLAVWTVKEVDQWIRASWRRRSEDTGGE